MSSADPRQLSERYTSVSDRFRSLWTFYQFLGGIFKHLDRGPLPLSYDFQDLHRRLQELVPGLAVPDAFQAEQALLQMDHELDKLHKRMRAIEEEFPPSLLRRFFDHLKRQDERILVALVKFYLQSPDLDDDTIDKLDILLTRLAEAPLDDGRALRRDRHELWQTFSRLAAVSGAGTLEQAEVTTLVGAVVELRDRIQDIGSFDDLLTSNVLDSFRDFKHRMGAAFLEPQVLVEVVSTNIAAKNRFQELYQAEEIRILEDTNRILEIERYLERHPNFADVTLREQIETFRRARDRFDSSRREENIKRDALLELRRSMNQILEKFDSRANDGGRPLPPAPAAAEGAPGNPGAVDGGDPTPTPPPAAAPAQPPRPGVAAASPLPDELPDALEYPSGQVEDLDPLSEEDTLTASDLLPADPLLNDALHTIISGLELAGWDVAEGQAVQSGRLHNLRLEPWESEAYFKLTRRQLTEDSVVWELQRFYLLAAALRVRMEEEMSLIEHANQSNSADRLMEALERAGQSLERAREFESRFRWFIDDMMFRGDTGQLEQVSRSRFRFLETYARLWLEHQSRGGLTPL